MTRWRKRACWSARGLCPEAWRVKRPAWQVSQLRRRVPCVTPSGSSTMSKQWQVGQTEAQAPQPWQRRATSAQSGSSKCSASHAVTAASGATGSTRLPTSDGAAAGDVGLVRREAESLFVGRDERLSLRCDDLDGEAAFERDEKEVGSARGGRAAAGGAAEAGLVAGGAGDRDDRRRLAPSEPELVAVVPAHHLVERLDPCGVAGDGAEDDVGREGRRDGVDRDVGAREPEREERLRRGEEERLEREARKAAVEDGVFEAGDGAVVEPAVGRTGGGGDGRPRGHEVGDEGGELGVGDRASVHRMNSCGSSFLKAPTGEGTAGSSVGTWPNCSEATCASLRFRRPSGMSTGRPARTRRSRRSAPPGGGRA